MLHNLGQLRRFQATIGWELDKLEHFAFTVGYLPEQKSLEEVVVVVEDSLCVEVKVNSPWRIVDEVQTRVLIKVDLVGRNQDEIAPFFKMVLPKLLAMGRLVVELRGYFGTKIVLPV